MSDKCDLYPRRKLDGKDSELAKGLIKWLGAGNRKLGIYLYALVNSNGFIAKHGLAINPETGEPSFSDVVKALDMTPKQVESLFSYNKKKSVLPKIGEAIEVIRRRIDENDAEYKPFKSTFLSLTPDGYVVSQENLDTDYGNDVAKDTIAIYEHITQQVRDFADAGGEHFEMPEAANFRPIVDDGGLSGLKFNELIDRVNNNKLTEDDARALISIFPPEDNPHVSTESVIKALHTKIIPNQYVSRVVNDWLQRMGRVQKIDLTALKTARKTHNIEQALSEAEQDCNVTVNPYSKYGKEVERKNIQKMFVELFLQAAKIGIKENYDKINENIAKTNDDILKLENALKTYERAFQKDKNIIIPNPLNNKGQLTYPNLKSLINAKKKKLREEENKLDRSKLTQSDDKIEAIRTRVLSDIKSIEESVKSFINDDETSDEGAINQSMELERKMLSMRKFIQSAMREVESKDDYAELKELLDKANNTINSILHNPHKSSYQSTKIAHFMSFFKNICGFSAGYNFEQNAFMTYATKYSSKALNVIADLLTSKSTSRNVIMSSFANMLSNKRFEANKEKTDLTNEVLRITREFFSKAKTEDTSFMYQEVITDEGNKMYFLNDGYDYEAYYKNKKNLTESIYKIIELKGFAPLTLHGKQKLSKFIDNVVFGGHERYNLTKELCDILKDDPFATNRLTNIVIDTITQRAESLLPKKKLNLTPEQTEYHNAMMEVINRVNKLDKTTGIGKHLPPQVEMKNYETLYQNKSSDAGFLKRLCFVFQNKFKLELDDNFNSRFCNTHVPKPYSMVLEDQSKLSQNFSQSILKRIDSAAEYSALNSVIPYIYQLCSQIVDQSLINAKKTSKIDGEEKEEVVFSNEELADFMNGENLVSLIRKLASEYVDDDRAELLENLAKFVNSNVYNNMGGKKTKKAMRILNPFLNFSTYFILANNYGGIGANFVTAMFQMLESSIASQDMKFVPFFKSCIRATVFGLPNRVIDTMSNKSDSLYTLLPRFFCPAGTESPLEIDIRKTMWGKATKLSILSLTYGAEESYFKEIVTMTILDSINVYCDGKKMTLLQAIDVKDGKLVMKGKKVLNENDGKELSFKDNSLNEIGNLINHVQTTLHGNYGKDRGLLRTYAWGAVLCQMKGWLGQVLHSFFSPAYWNPRLKRAEIGITVAPFYARHLYLKHKELAKSAKEHLSTSGTMTDEESVIFDNFNLLTGFKEFNSFLDSIPFVAAYQSMRGYKYLSKSQKASYRRFIIASAMYGLLRLLYQYYTSTKEKKIEYNSPFFKWSMSMLERNIVERGMYSPVPIILIDSILTMFKNPVPAINFFDRVVSGVNDFIDALVDDKEEDSLDYYYDWIDKDYKLIDSDELKLKKSLPWTRPYYYISDLEDDTKIFEPTAQKQ